MYRSVFEDRGDEVVVTLVPLTLGQKASTLPLRILLASLGSGIGCALFGAFVLAIIWINDRGVFEEWAVWTLGVCGATALVLGVIQGTLKTFLTKVSVDLPRAIHFREAALTLLSADGKEVTASWHWFTSARLTGNTLVLTLPTEPKTEVIIAADAVGRDAFERVAAWLKRARK